MTAIQKLDWSKGVPQMGGCDDQENLLLILEQTAKCQDEKVLISLRDRFIQFLSASPSEKVEKVEKAAVGLVGRKYTFKDGQSAYFRDSQVSVMRARSDQLNKRFENGDLHFPYLSKESFCFVVADFEVDCRKHEPPSFKTRVEVYKTFGSSLNWHNDLAEFLNGYVPVDLEGALLCYQLLKDDPKVMEKLKFRLRAFPHP